MYLILNAFDICRSSLLSFTGFYQVIEAGNLEKSIKIKYTKNWEMDETYP